MRLSYFDLRDIALQILSDYYRTPTLPFKALDVDDFATSYMRLTVRYHKFSDTRRTILGCIAYENTVLELSSENLHINERTVFLNECLKPDVQRGRRNFTLAHECSHQAIYLLDPAEYGKYQCREHGKSYSLRELTSSDDWFEWQANTLAAELLMPCHLIIKLLEKNKYRTKVRIYPEKKLLYPERRIIRSMADFLGVSKEALLIRLKQLQLLDFRSWEEYLREEEIDSLIGG